ncbi:MAG TPA: hypothetical protein VIR57_18370 [Chloroflexota bacterium]
MVVETGWCARLLFRVKSSKPGSTDPDLHSQLESLFHQVWRSEADWRLWDRVDAAVMIETLRAKRAARLPDEKAA